MQGKAAHSSVERCMCPRCTCRRPCAEVCGWAGLVHGQHGNFLPTPTTQALHGPRAPGAPSSGSPNQPSTCTFTRESCMHGTPGPRNPAAGLVGTPTSAAKPGQAARHQHDFGGESRRGAVRRSKIQKMEYDETEPADGLLFWRPPGVGRTLELPARIVPSVPSCVANDVLPAVPVTSIVDEGEISLPHHSTTSLPHQARGESLALTNPFHATACTSCGCPSKRQCWVWPVLCWAPCGGHRWRGAHNHWKVQQCACAPGRHHS